MMDIIGLAVGIIGTAIAIYQAAIINESKRRKNELQYLFAGINAAANQNNRHGRIRFHYCQNLPPKKSGKLRGSKSEQEMMQWKSQI